MEGRQSLESKITEGWSIEGGSFNPENIDLVAAKSEVEQLEWSGRVQHSNPLLANRIRAAQLVSLASSLVNPELFAEADSEKKIRQEIIAAAMKLFIEWRDDYDKRAAFARISNVPAVQAIEFLGTRLGEGVLPETTQLLGLSLIGFLQNPEN